MLQKNKKRIAVSIGVVCFALGIYFLSYNYLESKVLKAYDKMNLEILMLNAELENELDSDETEEVVDETEELEDDSDEVIDNNQNNSQEDSQNNNQVTNKKPTVKVDIYEKYYIAKLKIPKINLEKGLVAIDSKYNTVNKNIQIIKGSNYPNVSGGNLILASHSGNNAISYFKNLYKLTKGDKCYITYNNKTYTYKIVNFYNQEKDGTIGIYRDYSKTTLTLVTCTRNSKTKQTVYIAELIEVR